MFVKYIIYIIWTPTPFTLACLRCMCGVIKSFCLPAMALLRLAAFRYAKLLGRELALFKQYVNLLIVLVKYGNRLYKSLCK